MFHVYLTSEQTIPYRCTALEWTGGKIILHTKTNILSVSPQHILKIEVVVT